MLQNKNKKSRDKKITTQVKLYYVIIIPQLLLHKSFNLSSKYKNVFLIVKLQQPQFYYKAKKSLYEYH